jgi:malate dehydrogenase (oxaloacetate-decarboxylating)(NADP+)
VGEACQKFSKIYRGAPRALYISIKDKGMIRKILENWKTSDVHTIVVTDGERILGLGDLGMNGIGIPIGKLSLYTAMGGIHPDKVLPVHIDVGTDNEENLKDPYYLGLRQERERGQVYDDLIAEFFLAVQDKFGKDVLVQFEDFGNKNAFRLLTQWKDKACTFNDDIQGTAAVALAGLFASERVTGTQLKDQTFLFSGAGEAGVGIAQLIALAVSQEGEISLEEARKKIFLVESKGLVTKNRPGELQDHKKAFAHDIEDCDNLLSAVKTLKPSCLIGVSAIPNTFNEEIVKTMAELNERPIISALSNPTSKAECTAKQAYEWTDGKAIFCSGSPFDPVELKDGRRFVPGQGKRSRPFVLIKKKCIDVFCEPHARYNHLILYLANNAYVFPGIGLGVLAAGSKGLTDLDMLLAAETLAGLVSEEQLQSGCMFPAFSRIREVSKKIAVQIALRAHENGLATNEKPTDMESYVESIMYDPWR